MCGIIGIIAKNNADEQIIKNLKLLEYRGYDSAGISTLDDKITTTKYSGKINNLENNIKYKKESTCGIAHTRWATHGQPNNINAHPHNSQNNIWSIVHNGIIENYTQLKKNLEKQQYVFKSETDSEVICNLLEQNNKKKPIQNLIEICKKLKGSYALCCLNKDYQNHIFMAKNKSPLFVAQNENEIIIASDIICFIDKTEKYYTLNDNEFCEAKILNNQKIITFFNKNGEKINKNTQFLKKYSISNSKNNYKHYMLKEIFEQSNVLENICRIYKNEKILNFITKSFLTKFNKIELIGCGTAYHASLMGVKYLNKIAKLNANAYIASEYRYSKPIINNKTLFIFVSQSGETADTLAVLDMAKKNKATTVALTNVLYSTLAQKCKYVLPVCAGTEIAVASTKAYTAQLLILYILANYIKEVLHNKSYNFYKDILKMSKKITIPLNCECCDIVNDIINAKTVFFIGRDLDYITCLEASLKLKEITYVYSMEHPAGELKHGFLALIDDKSIVIAIATQKELFYKTLNNAFEAKARGAKVIIATQFDLDEDTKKNFSYVIKLPKNKVDLMPISTIPFFQTLAYYTSISKKLDPDKPKNLAKSVTVE